MLRVTILKALCRLLRISPALLCADDLKAARVGCETKRLPMSRSRKMARDLRIGEGGWTTPWQLEMKPDGTCALQFGAPIDNEKGGTFDLYVERRAHGYVVDIHDTDYKWRHTGMFSKGSIPISGVIR